MQPQPLGGPAHVAAKLLDRAANVLDLKTSRRVGQGLAQIVDRAEGPRGERMKARSSASMRSPTVR